MYMIRHSINCKHFMFVVLYNCSYIFIKLFYPYMLNEIIPSPYCKNKLDIQLCVGITHKNVMFYRLPRWGKTKYNLFSTKRLPRRGYRYDLKLIYTCVLYG